MPDAVGVVKKMQQVAVSAIEASKPVNICFGDVLSVSPLQIDVEQKMILDEAQLILSRNVTDYVTEVTVQWDTFTHKIPHTHNINLTDSNGDSVTGKTDTQNVSHSHDIEGRKQMTIHNGLIKGEKVILVRQQEGQKFLVWDRIGGGSV